MLQREAFIIIIIITLLLSLLLLFLLRTTKLTDTLVPRLCPLVLAIKVSGRQGRGLGSKRKAMGIELFEYAAGEKKFSK